VAGSFGYRNESSGFMKGGKFPNQLSKYSFLMIDSVPWR
jgi:hypothetical protein